MRTLFKDCDAYYLHESISSHSFGGQLLDRLALAPDDLWLSFLSYLVIRGSYKRVLLFILES